VTQFVSDCARYGLLPGGSSPECYFNTFDRKLAPKMNVSYHGLKTLLFRAGVVKNIVAKVVHEEDFFDSDLGDFNKPITHKPSLLRTGQKVSGYYCIFSLPDGTKRASVMSIAEANQLKKKRSTKDSSPWNTNLDAMIEKTLIRDLAKHLNKSGDQALAHFMRNELFEEEETTVSDSPARSVQFISPTEPRPAALDFLDEMVQSGALRTIEEKPLTLKKDEEPIKMPVVPQIPDYTGHGPMVEDRL
jgi:recombinational DNA repair protein RecT